MLDSSPHAHRGDTKGTAAQAPGLLLLDDHLLRQHASRQDPLRDVLRPMLVRITATNAKTTNVPPNTADVPPNTTNVPTTNVPPNTTLGGSTYYP